ncbi:MAG: 4Fe-4S binding protein [Methanobrevibacter sp.]|uniref:4Fe-4S binding protein n=1 Tax=Methanobrevibacter sp. TaxID=66852 RepID=UPI0026E07F13|nr:4Fe-4S binding protein [Methanobrevibacter sp.]MDO5849019.1 4Fe-4S binding protein [Methanobrevibacter sp.]
MDISFDKKIKSLEHSVYLKSVDLEDNNDDFKFELGDFQSEVELIAIGSDCVRCNLCVEVCPVDAIDEANLFKIAEIRQDDCVKCEICVQTCPITCIKIIKNLVEFSADEGDVVKYYLSERTIPHRIIRMEDIAIDYETCNAEGDVPKFCPTGAYTFEFKEYFEDHDIEVDIALEEDTLYPVIDKKLCIGCGACLVTSIGDFITLKRYVGSLINTKNLEINQDICVNCYLCEENCPTDAIKLENGEVVLDDDKCIRCIECTSCCPVGALKLVKEEEDE